MEFQFKLNQGKKLTKRVKILQKIENLVSNFCRQKKFVYFYVHFKLLHLKESICFRRYIHYPANIY